MIKKLKVSQGFTFIEVMLAVVIITITSMGLMYGVVHARSELRALEIKERATDIHLEPQQDIVIVRIRIDGVLQTIMTPPNSSLSGLVTRIKILSNLNIAERRLPQDGRFTIKASNKEIDVVRRLFLGC